VAQLLSKAIELDPEFGAAYAERAGVHFETLLNNLDTSAEEIQRIRSDLDAAVRLAPEHPNTLAARAWYAALIDGDFRSAAELFTAAERAGLSDSFWMSAIPGVLGTLGRYDDSLLACQHAVTLDPANSTAITRYAFALMLFHRPLEAVHVVDFGAANSPGDLRLTWLRPMVRFSFTGNRDSLAPVLERPALDPRSRTAGFPLPVAFVFLRWSGRVDEFDALLKDVPTETVRAQFAAVGQEPVARYRGWTALLRGDRAAAGNEGRRVLAFLASTEETEFNRAFRRLLAAEAYTFLGESARAVATMREAPDIRFDFGLDFQKSKAAVYAWAGAEDDALGLLERLATRTPGVGPAEVARDPLYTIPLAGNPRFASLVARLEAEMRELQVE